MSEREIALLIARIFSASPYGAASAAFCPTDAGRDPRALPASDASPGRDNVILFAGTRSSEIGGSR